MTEPSAAPAKRRGEPVRITFRDEVVAGYSGEPVILSLYSQGIKAVARSKKLYRWRGLYCLDPYGTPLRLLADGELVDPSKTFPREGLILHSHIRKPLLVSIFHPMLDGHFHHRKIIRNKLMWRITKSQIKRLANLPDIVESRAEKRGRKVMLDADLVVVGGGMAGLSAASAAGKHGVKTLLLEASRELGGRMRYDLEPPPGTDLTAPALLAGLTDEARKLGIQVLTRTVFTGFFEDYATAYSEEDRVLYVLRAKAFVIATGTIDLPCIFRGNDLPGVLSASTALEMINTYGVTPGKKGVILGASEYSLRVARQLRRSGIELTILDPSENTATSAHPREIGHYIPSVIDVRAVGDKSVEKVEVTHSGGREVVEADFVVCSSLPHPDLKIIGQLNSKTHFVNGVGFAPLHGRYMELTDSVYVAGGASGSPYSILHLIEGEIAGLAAASKIIGKDLEGELSEKINEYDKKIAEIGAVWKKEVPSGPSGSGNNERGSARPPNLFVEKPHKDAFICMCEDVTTLDLAKTVFEKGCRILELVKRSVGICTGRCQGRLCMVNASLYVSYLTGEHPSHVGLTRTRVPAAPLPLNILGGE